MATGKVEMFSELRCTVLNGRADLDLKKIIFTFGIVFFFHFVQQNRTLYTFFPPPNTSK